MSSQKKIQTLLKASPSFLLETNTFAWEQVSEHYCGSAPEWEKGTSPWSEGFLQDLFTIWSRSDFVRDTCVRYPQWLSAWSCDNAILSQARSVDRYRKLLEQRLDGIGDEENCMCILREFRRAEMLRIIWRDCLNRSELDETLADVTALADVCVIVALNFAYSQLIERFGVPRSKSDGREQQRMLVLAMGKQGAKELNVSSDIDLILAYPESGVTDHPSKPIDNHLFFTRLGQKLIQLLDKVSSDGFVFRVDLRLRPYGESGALALNFSAFEDYYQHQGREWERYAMVKARIVNSADDVVQAARLMAIIRPFVYRKYADFSSIQALREMKRLIMSEVHRKGGNQNIKLGHGGIREIEFIAQSCQLIYGGRDESIQMTGLLSVYQQIKIQGYLPEVWVDSLVAAYRFLRNLEHAIQGLADQQTQLIPDSPEQRDRVSWSLGYVSWEELEPHLLSHRNKVSDYFDSFLAEPESEISEQVSDKNATWLNLWQIGAELDQWEGALKGAKFEDPADSYQRLMVIRGSRLFMSMSSDANQRFEQFLSVLLTAVTETPEPSITLARILALVNAILGRSVYFVLLYENPSALKQLCLLCSESPWVAEHLAKSPVILDELLDVRSLYHPPDREGLRDELRQQLLRIPEDDLEAEMNCLRTFRQSHMLRVAAAEIGAYLPLMKVSDYLTFLAEVILEQTLNIAWRNLVAKHGLPSGKNGEAQFGQGFAIVGYGKLGGLELGYSSDLDMVFLYDANDQGMTSGPRSINNQVFYVRLGQRIIHILSAQTTQGTLYESDLRLRPSGNSGLLVSSLKAFEKYQRQEAWVWEHQALVRARGITGDPELIEQFNLIRQSVLTQERLESSLQLEVVNMREKMKAAAKPNDIKVGSGGLVDIEFITQYGVLRYAVSKPSLLDWTDNIRLLEALARCKCFGEIDLAPLVSIYRELRSALHRKSLSSDKEIRTLEDFSDLSLQVQAIWQQIFKNSDNN